MRRIFIGTLGTETNPQSPIPTGMNAFRDTLLFHGDATRHPPQYFSAPLHVWRQAAETCSWEVCEGLCAYAEPGGIVPEPVYQELKNELLSNIAAALPLDAVLLNLHGAMISETCQDCEGDLLDAVRNLIGPDTLIAIELDLHCHLSQTILDCSDIVLTYKEYPHTDPEIRASELFNLVHRTLAGEIRPVMAMVDCNRIASSMQTLSGPMAELVAWMHEAEKRPGVLAVSLVHGFVHADVPDLGVRALVVADEAQTLVDSVARELSDCFCTIYDRASPNFLKVPEALDLAAVTPGTIVVADSADNPGAGSAGDATFVLREVISLGLTDATLGIFWDPVAVRLCIEAGIDARINLRLGGKCGPCSGDPLDLVVTVRGLATDHWRSFGQTRNRIGHAAWISVENGPDLLLSSIRAQTFHPDAFTGLGMPVAGRRLIVVKSAIHFLAGFEPLADAVLYVDSPGTSSPTDNKRSVEQS